MKILTKCRRRASKIGELYALTTTEKIRIITAAVLQAIGIAYLFYENIIFSLLLCPYFFLWCRGQYRECIERKKQELVKQFQDGMQAVSFALNVGYSMENAFGESIQELVVLYGEESIIVQEFYSIVYRVNRNEKLEDVLEQFADRSQIDDVKYFAAVFRYAKSSGGDLILIIKNTVRTIGEKIETDSEIQLVISGKKMEQRIMGMIPFGIILYLRFTAPEFIEPLYGNATGGMIMTVCLVLYALSIWMAKRIIHIEV